MTSPTVFDSIKAHVQSYWTATEQVKWENDYFYKRSAGNPAVWEQVSSDPPTAGVWILVEMQGTLYAQMTIGEDDQADNRWDEEGALMIHCVAPKLTGTRDLRVVALAAANLFRGITLDSGRLEFLEATIGLGEAEDNGMFYRITVTVDFRRMED